MMEDWPDYNWQLNWLHLAGLQSTQTHICLNVFAERLSDPQHANPSNLPED